MIKIKTTTDKDYGGWGKKIIEITDDKGESATINIVFSGFKNIGSLEVKINNRKEFLRDF